MEMHGILRLWRRACAAVGTSSLAPRLAAASIFVGSIALAAWWSAETMLGL